jgi:hypothetical protein
MALKEQETGNQKKSVFLKKIGYFVCISDFPRFFGSIFTVHYISLILSHQQME